MCCYVHSPDVKHSLYRCLKRKKCGQVLLPPAFFLLWNGSVDVFRTRRFRSILTATALVVRNRDEKTCLLSKCWFSTSRRLTGELAHSSGDVGLCGQRHLVTEGIRGHSSARGVSPYLEKWRSGRQDVGRRDRPGWELNRGGPRGPEAPKPPKPPREP